MDKMCNKSQAEDLSKTVTSAGEIENLTNRGSPVLKCFNHTKATKGSNLDSSDYDIPSYQVNQSVNSRASSKYGNDTCESVLPFSPVFSPIPVTSSVQFQPPSINTLSTVVKNEEKFSEDKVNISSNASKIQTVKPCGVFESLGMTDKDISWVSSMATPPPKNIPGSEFNTIEKATFFPEEKFQNIQPRALFSPTLDDDSGCHPIVFTSESDDEEYKSNIRLSDVCATLKQLEFKSFDLVKDNSLDKIILDKDCVISPIIKTKKKKLGSVKKKKKGSLVISPENKEKYEFAVSLESLESEKVKRNSGSHFIEDDSFQSMSFSGIDELCKTLVSEQSNASMVSKAGDCDKTLVTSDENKVLKKFYPTKTATDVFEVFSMDNLHSYAKALEESDKSNPIISKPNMPLPQSGIVRFDILNSDNSKVDGTKRLHSEITEETNECKEKKFKKFEEENSGWENVKQYLSDSQLNVSDGEIFRTVENLEKTLASQESRDSEKVCSERKEGVEIVASHILDPCISVTENSATRKEDANKAPKYPDLLETTEMRNNDSKNSDQSVPVAPLIAFTTASGSKISVSEKALTKARELLWECDENLEFEKKTLTSHLDIWDTKLGEIKVLCSEDVFMKEFSTGSGKEIKVDTLNNSEALKKAKDLMSDCKVSESLSELLVSPGHIKFHEKLLGKFGDDLMSGFFTGSGKQIQISDEALQKAKTLMSEFDDDIKEHFVDVKSSAEGFKTILDRNVQISAKTLEKAKVVDFDKGKDGFWLKLDCKKFPDSESNKSSNENLRNLKTGLMKGNPVKLNQTSAKGSEKAESVMRENEGKPKEKLGVFKGFSTCSGKTIQISAEALEKAKSLMRNCEQEFNENSDKLATEWIGELDNKVSEDEREGKNLDDKSEESECSKVCFSTALGNTIEVSKKALEKAKELSVSIVENTVETSGSSAFPQTEPPLMGFSTAGGTKVTISEAALAKAKERMNEWDQINLEDCVTGSCKTIIKNGPEVIGKGTESGENSSDICSNDDWNEIIPSWLHVYNTSPSIASERTELSPLLCHEDGKSSKSEREYIVRSPILGAGDRFHGKRKKRKLRFEEDKKRDGNISGFVVPYKNLEKRNTTKRTSDLSLDFSIPFKKMKFVEDCAVAVVNVKVERARIREEQEKCIKQKQKVKPLKGSHLNRKCSEKQMSWKEAVAGASPEVHSEEFLRSFGICEDVLQINIENAVSYRLKGENFFGPDCRKNTKGIPVGDDCLLILNDDDTFGVEELKRAFLASPGVQPNLVPHGWVENHFKWIIWKLANYERCFPQYFGGSSLTPKNIILQLKYRYDREIDKNERSALKKILERDDTSIKRMVLCVCDIQKVTVGEAMGYKLQLTDGWYSCPAHTDPAMTRIVEEGKLRVGTKLVTQGATLVNCEQGVSPLEINGDVYLKISTNSTRRIRWDAKLGFQKNPENFPISLSSILPQGGPISRIDVIIVRTYPTLYMEKTTDGRHVTRNRRSEEKADSAYRRIQEQRMESICNEIQTEMRKSANLDKKLNVNCVNNFEQDEDLAESSSDPSFLREFMSADKRKLAEKLNQNDIFSRQLAEKIKNLEKEKLNKRNVSEFMRAKIVDFRKPDFNNSAVLSVWNPNEDLTALLSEGRLVSLMNVTISNSSRIYKPLQINTTRQTQYKQILRNVKYPARKLTRLKDVSSKVCPAFGEMDIVGMVALIRDVSYGSRLSQVIYLTDLEMNFVGVVFWGSCKDYGWENVLRTASIVACSNLQWKKNYTPQDVPSLYVNEHSVFTENPKHVHLKEEIERLKQGIPKDKTAFLSKCEEDLTAKLADTKWRINTSKNSSADDSNLSGTSRSRAVNGFESKPTASSTPIKPFSLRMDPNEAEPSPIQKRIEKLQSYGEPPSLIPLLVRNNAKRKMKKS